MKLAVILLSCNQLHLTNAVVADIAREADDGVDLYVVDNGGGYQRQWREMIIKPNENMRWVRGVNMAIRMARSINEYDAVICLNDDIRLSPGFFDAMREELSVPEIGLVAPSYDDVYLFQRNPYQGPADKYPGGSRVRQVDFVDGTAFGMRTDVIDEVGLLDEEHFGKYGWGSDIDYSYRMRTNHTVERWKPYYVVVTHKAFINHFHQGSAKHVEKDWSGKAGQEMEEGMNAKYGPNWREVTKFHV
jgi:GT2 family glycosyltransferase